MHYVIGGHGPQVMVLLHGWPQSWYEYRQIMPSLLPGRTVIAIDLPGMGDSTGNPPSMTKTVLARYVHRLLNHLGHRENVQVVAHDFGVSVAYPLAAQYREQVAGLFLMDYGLVGKNLKFATIESMFWHFSFNKHSGLTHDKRSRGVLRAKITFVSVLRPGTPRPSSPWIPLPPHRSSTTRPS